MSYWEWTGYVIGLHVRDLGDKFYQALQSTAVSWTCTDKITHEI